jgi:CheY-like chemotaxis protein
MKTLQQQQQQTNLMTFISSNANIRILLAEDNLVNQLLIKKVIEKAGYILELATNGLQVLEKLSHSQYDLILMDVQMPDMNGLETTKEIISRYADNRPKIIAITAGSFGDDEKHCMEAGMDDTLEKPFKIEQLEEKLAKFKLI